jgi:hypothetical protein
MHRGQHGYSRCAPTLSLVCSWAGLTHMQQQHGCRRSSSRRGEHGCRRSSSRRGERSTWAGQQASKRSSITHRRSNSNSMRGARNSTGRYSSMRVRGRPNVRVHLNVQTLAWPKNKINSRTPRSTPLRSCTRHLPLLPHVALDYQPYQMRRVVALSWFRRTATYES